nr:hypothetical protein [Tetragenococcus muriaticus]
MNNRCLMIKNMKIAKTRECQLINPIQSPASISREVSIKSIQTTEKPAAAISAVEAGRKP